uniref:Uncharacterized protein n=1 Tax=Astyanax mexicanus TaxID=7994 RepID=A0A8B9RKR9_ASTMX
LCINTAAVYLSACVPDIPDPSVEVYQQVGNSKSLIVVCQFKMKTSVSSFHLSVRNGDGKRMLNNPACIAETTCVFNITTTSPVSFTCVHVVSARTDIQTQLSDVFIYQPYSKILHSVQLI